MDLCTIMPRLVELINEILCISWLRWKDELPFLNEAQKTKEFLAMSLETFGIS